MTCRYHHACCIRLQQAAATVVAAFGLMEAPVSQVASAM